MAEKETAVEQKQDPRSLDRVQHIITAHQFNRPVLDYFFELTNDMKRLVQLQRRQGMTAEYVPEEDQRILAQFEDSLKRKFGIVLFYEASTRTEASFDIAAKRLGMGMYTSKNPKKFSSELKGETFEDTIRNLSQYAEVIILRHIQEGHALKAAEVARVPLINAGDGGNEHPTQALLDLYTLREHRVAMGEQGIDGITLALVGDLLSGRTTRSLARALAHNYDDITLHCVAAKSQQFDQDMCDELNDAGVTIHLNEKLDPVMPKVDGVYLIRVQRERHSEGAKTSVSDYAITPHNVNRLPKNAIIMHPGPRYGWDVDKDEPAPIDEQELSVAVDDDPRAKYISHQVPNGMFVRMALLYHVVLAAFQTNPDGSYKLPENHMFIPCSKTQPSV